MGEFTHKALARMTANMTWMYITAPTSTSEHAYYRKHHSDLDSSCVGNTPCKIPIWGVGFAQWPNQKPYTWNGMFSLFSSRTSLSTGRGALDTGWKQQQRGGGDTDPAAPETKAHSLATTRIHVGNRRQTTALRTDARPVPPHVPCFF